jgi:hypothetical protein
MPTAAASMTTPTILEAHEPLAARGRVRHAGEAAGRGDAESEGLPAHLIGCAFESRDLPWSRQAVALAQAVPDGASIIGAADRATPPSPMR